MEARYWGVYAAAFVLLAAFPLVHATPFALDTFAVTSEKPGGYDYVVEDLVVDISGTLTLINVDLRSHDLVSVLTGPETNPWCERQFDHLGHGCPLFASPLLDLGQQGVVEGIDQLTPFGTYTFYCSIHTWMVGTIVAV